MSSHIVYPQYPSSILAHIFRTPNISLSLPWRSWVQHNMYQIFDTQEGEKNWRLFSQPFTWGLFLTHLLFSKSITIFTCRTWRNTFQKHTLSVQIVPLISLQYKNYNRRCKTVQWARRITWWLIVRKSITSWKNSPRVMRCDISKPESVVPRRASYSAIVRPELSRIFSVFVFLE